MKQERPELTTELLPCPFCGSEPKVETGGKGNFVWAVVCCDNNSCLRPSTDWYASKIETCYTECALRWNLRYKPVEGK